MVSADKLKNFNRGITLIEVIVAIFIVVLFSMMLVSDFPKIRRQFALSRATYKLAQDLRRTQDMSFSGLQLKNKDGDDIVANGYGLYFDPAGSDKAYMIYANVNEVEAFDAGSAVDCGDQTGEQEGEDCIIETINADTDSRGVFIKNTDSLSINFTPPNPKTTITESSSEVSSADITLGLEADESSERKVSVNTSGLIEVK